MNAKTLFLMALILLVIFSGCSSQPAGEQTVAANLPVETQPAAESVVPAETQPDAENQELNAQVLESMFLQIEDDPWSEIHSLLIQHNGVIIAEKYYHSYTQDSKHTLYSCTKSVISALVGIAIEEGYLQGVDQTVSDFFPEAIAANPDPRKSAMRVEDLLTMRAGLDWEEGNPAYRSLSTSSDWVAFVLKEAMVADPGSEFNYCSGCTHVLSGILYQATGTLTQEFAESRLFEPLGITNYTWETDAVGNAIGGWGLELTTRDMAKFGTLFLNNGRWEGKQVVPAGWVEKSTQPVGTTGEEWQYGYQWWSKPAENIFAAQGLHGQKIFVVPDQNLVVVVTAGADDSGALGNLVLDAAIEAVK